MQKALLLCFFIIILSCGQQSKTTQELKTQNDFSASTLEFNGSDKELVEAFNWSKNKALSFAYSGKDSVGYWYEAALPNREAFCMRDVSHQAIGAELLGLGKHNFNMFQKFAQNISKEMDYCSYWEINRYNKPAPVDYENDKDFWYNLPANFDVTYNAYRLYNWTGNSSYINHADFKNFYHLSMNEYVDHWKLGHEEVLRRERDLHLSNGKASRFGNKRGIPTYNEGGRGETLLGIDMTASLIAGYDAYSKILEVEGDSINTEIFRLKTQKELEFLNDTWWDKEKEAYRTILYTDNSYDYFMIGENQAFLHYLYYFNAIKDQHKIKKMVADYKANFDKLIVELKSYLPIMFYENGEVLMANKMIIDLCSPVNQRRDYPENSFTVIEHLTRGLMGINVDAATKTFSSIPRLVNDSEWAEMNHIPVLSNKLKITHKGLTKSIATNLIGESIKWKAQIPGSYEYLYVNGHRMKSLHDLEHGATYSYIIIELNKGAETTVSVDHE